MSIFALIAGDLSEVEVREKALSYSSRVPGVYETPTFTRLERTVPSWLALWQRKGRQGRCSTPDQETVWNGYTDVGKLELATKSLMQEDRLGINPGGIYCAASIEKRSGIIRAWCSRPSIRSIYYHQSDDYCVISSHPYLAALLSGPVELSDDYAADYLSIGYAMHDQSPFRGVQIIPVNGSLRIDGRKITVSNRPLYDWNDHSLQCAEAEKLDIFVEELVRATRFAQAPTPANLMLSGGKDSRTIISASRQIGLQINAITYGKSYESETKLAYQVADACGYPLETRFPRLSSDDLLEGVIKTIHRADGLAPSEPHTSLYAPPHLEKNSVIMMGHGELQRGGFARTMRNTPQGVQDIICGQISSFTSEKLKERFLGYYNLWESSRKFSSHLEKLFWFNLDYRAGRWLSQHYLDYSREYIPVYPLSDSRFAEVCGHLSMFEKVSERIVFQAMTRLHEPLGRLPLDHKNWRFELNQPSDLDPSGFVSRGTFLQDDAPAVTATFVPEVSDDIIYRMFLEASKLTPPEEYEHMLSTTGRNLVRGVLSDGPSYYKAVSPNRVALAYNRKFLWRLICYSLHRSSAAML